MDESRCRLLFHDIRFWAMSNELNKSVGTGVRWNETHVVHLRRQ